MPKELIEIMDEADSTFGFLPDGLLDVARSKCSIRTFVFSAYAERGHLIVGPANKTEFELGYFLPFGDGLAHIFPLLHLYKSQVQQLAPILGSSNGVIHQPPSAGFWIGDEDLDGIAHWLFNKGPIQVDLELDIKAEKEIRRIYNELSFRAIDIALIELQKGGLVEKVSTMSGLSAATIRKLESLWNKSGEYKRRKLGASLLES